MCDATPHFMPQGRDSEFVAMLNAFRPSGGLFRGNDILCISWNSTLQAEGSHCQEGTPFSFSWADANWLPLFQFQLPGWSLRPGIEPVLRELRPLLDSWELARWFSTPNDWLQGAIPADLIRTDPRAVFDAARADRFLIAG